MKRKDIPYVNKVFRCLKNSRCSAKNFSSRSATPRTAIMDEKYKQVKKNQLKI